jgi:predicted regulator of Ras-like GTPase activity (Roadblock/LC7/MglB family)
MERKTCTLSVSAGEKEGRLYFREGVLLEAETGGLSADVAALEIVSWADAVIEISSTCRRQKRRITANVGELLLECFRLKDESAESGSGVPARETPWPENGADGDGAPEATFEKESNMGATEKLKELGMIEGFAGAGLFTPAGENLALLSGGTAFKAEVGVLANNVLMNAQKSSLEMGTGRGQQVHIEAEKAHILVRCLNEGTDPLKSQPGKAHIHMVLVLTSDASIGLAKMKVNSIIQSVAEDFRM